MAMHLNECRFAGRVVADAEPPRVTKSGRLVKFRMAVGKGKKNQQTGEWEDGKTLWLDVVFFGNERNDWLVDKIEKEALKGVTVYVGGEMETDEWDDKQTGQKRSKNVLIARDVQFPEGSQERKPKQVTPLGDPANPFAETNEKGLPANSGIPF